MNELQRNDEIDHIILQSTSLQEQGKWAEADRYIGAALLKYPSDVDLSAEYANIMMERAYWSEGSHTNRVGYYQDASERLRAIIDTCPEHTPATIYNKLGLAYMRLGCLDAAESIAKKGMIKHPENIELFITYGRIRDTLRCSHASGALRGFINKYIKLLFGKTISAGLENFLFPYEYCVKTEIGHNCYQNFKSGNISDSINFFLNLVNSTNLSGSNNIWLNSYYELIKGSTDVAITFPKISLPLVKLKPQPIKKILVSGMGWSGSGAMLYFLGILMP